MGVTGERLDHRGYLGTGYFPVLDGLRALCVLLVVTAHVHAAAWAPIAGRQGVIGFFVLSGFLITTLCAREATAEGRVALGAFYVRRAFRILPLYLVVLAAYVVFVVVLGQEAQKRSGLLLALPYFLTFTNEIPVHWGHAHVAIPFFQTWSLGVEEKFYVVWPLLGYGLLLGVRRARVALLAAVVAALTVAQAGPGGAWAGWYGALAIGCLLGVLLNDPRAYRVLAASVRPWTGALALAVLVADHLLVGGHSNLATVLYPWVFAWLILALLVADSRVAGWARSRPAVFVGTRSYGIYLVHLLALAIVDRFVVPADALSPSTGLEYLLAIALSLAIADVLRRAVERPMIGWGRALTAAHRPAIDRPPATAAAG